MAHVGRPGYIEILGDGKLLLVGTDQGGCLWDPITGVQVGRTMPSNPWMAVSQNGRVIAGSLGKNFYLWDVPQPAVDDVNRLKREIESATGFTLDSARQIQRLNVEEWEKRRRP